MKSEIKMQHVMQKYHKNWLILSVSFSLMACEKPVEKPVPARPALVMTVGQEGANSIMALVGEIKPRYESAQGFRVAGKIIERKVEVGALVKKGQLLAKLDNADANLAVQANNADIASAEAQLALAKANLERQRQLIDKKFISAAALDSYEAAYKSAQARVQQTKAQTAVSGNQTRYTSLSTERDGVVSMIRAEPGQLVAAGEVIVNIIDPTQLEVQIPVPESRMSNLAVNDEATMRLWAKREKSYPAKVREIAPVANEVSRTFLVKLSLQSADEDVRIGMTAGVRFSKEQSGAVLVPSPAVMQKNQKSIVWLVNAKNQANPKEVTVTSYREDGALITEGLSVGDKVVVAGVEVLTTGQVVRPVEAAK